MLGRLIRKDLVLNRWMVALVAVGIVTVVAILYLGVGTSREGGPPSSVVLFIASWAGSLVPSLFAGRDDRFRTFSFDLGLPVTRGRVVLARYLLALLLVPVWIALVAAARWACGWSRFPVEFVHPESLVLGLAASVAGMGLVFPLVVRVGFMGLLYGLVGLQVLGLVTVVAVRQVPAASAALSQAGRIVPALAGLRARLGDPVFLAAAAGALLALNALSFAAARALYRRRDA
jgi:hypothetical protein